MNDTCHSEWEFRSEVKMFLAEYKKIVADLYKEWPEGQLLFEYFSYSPDSSIRWGGLETARLSERHYERLLTEPEIMIRARMSLLPQLPEKYFRLVARNSSTDIGGMVLC